MKLAKALKLKSRITGRITELNIAIQSNNSYIIGSGDSNRPDVVALNKYRTGLIQDLVKLKTAIAIANNGIFEKIETMAQAKSLITTWNSVPHQHGVIINPHHFNTTAPASNQFHATFRRQEIEEQKATLQMRIEALQDEIDEYNAVTEVNVNFTTFAE